MKSWVRLDYEEVSQYENDDIPIAKLVALTELSLVRISLRSQNHFKYHLKNW